MVSDVKQRTEGRPCDLMTSDDYPAYEDGPPERLRAGGHDHAHGADAARWCPRRSRPPEMNYATVQKRRREGPGGGDPDQLIFGTMAALGRPCGVEGEPAGEHLVPGANNATDRHHNARKVRKTYTFSKDWQVHESMTYFTMYSYNFCWPVRTLADRDEQGRPRQRSPAMAAGLTDHVWTMREWITYPSVRFA